MQVEIETEPKEWQPKTLSITFETEEEIKAFRDMLNCAISVSEVVYAYPPNQIMLCRMLKVIHHKVLGYSE